MKVLACIDQSQFVQGVCEHAAWSAAQLSATIELLHVIERHQSAPVVDLSGRLELDSSEALLHELSAIDEQQNRSLQEQGRVLLDDAKARVAAVSRATVTLRLAQGDLVGHLKTHSGDADLVVVGRRGEAKETARHHFGRNLRGVIREGHRPILIAPEAFNPIRRFLFAYDGGKSASAVIDFMVVSGLLRDLPGRLLYVGDDSGPVVGSIAEAAARLNSAGFDVTHAIRDGDTEEVILSTMEQEGFDMLVMGAFGHSRIRELLVGSTTIEMLQRCTAPILIVH